MKIGSREIGPGNPPYVCAEMSGEHRGRFDLACDLIKAAKAAGADAIKAQLFDPAKLAAARGGADKVLTEGLWKGRSLGELYRETHTPREWFPDLFDYAREVGITLFSSVFDEEGVDFLETLDCPAYKISSFELTDVGLIRKAASTGKSIIMSTGMADEGDIVHALACTMCTRSKCALLHCVSAYPCQLTDANLMRLAGFRRFFTGVTGLSDHTLGTTAAIVATALGASIIEKHITLSRADGGPDAPFSLEPHEFKKLVQDVKDAYASLGTGKRPDSEAPYRSLRRQSNG